MSTQLEMLFQLQVLDTRLLEKQRVVVRYESELAARQAAIAASTARIDALLAARKEGVAQRALAERKIEDLQESLRQKRQRAQKARNEKEVRAGQDEVNAAQEEIRECETILLEAMAKVEELEATIAKAKSDRAELENEDHRQIGEAEQRIESLRGELATDKTERDGAAGGIEPPLRKKYEFLLERRAGLAVVEVDGTGCCSGCHVQIPPQTLLEIRRTQSLRVCPMCQRILFVSVTPPAAPAE